MQLNFFKLSNYTAVCACSPQHRTKRLLSGEKWNFLLHDYRVYALFALMARVYFGCLFCIDTRYFEQNWNTFWQPNQVFDTWASYAGDIKKDSRLCRSDTVSLVDGYQIFIATCFLTHQDTQGEAKELQFAGIRQS